MFFSLIALLLAIFILVCVQSDELFWSAFWPNFFADLIVGLLLTLFISKIVEDYRRRDALIVMVVDLKNGRISLKFDLKNVGKQKYDRDDIYWHVFLPSNLDLDDKQASGDGARWGKQQTINGVEYNQYSGNITQPVFPQRSIDLFEIELLSIDKTKIKDQAVLEKTLDSLFKSYYRLSTAFGLIPNPGNVKQLDPDILPVEYVRKIDVLRP